MDLPAQIAPMAAPTEGQPSPTLAAMALHSRLFAELPAKVARTITRQDLPALRSYVLEAQRLTKPATDRLIVRVLEGLFLHYPARNLSTEEAAVLWGDWVEDFADVPEDLLRSACDGWRRSSERFAPSPGQLLAQIGGSNHWGHVRASLLKRAAEVLRLAIQTQPVAA